MKIPKHLWVGLFFIATLPFVYLNGGLEATINIALGTFSGRLENVNTSCFADGECSVDVGGKHVTLTVGWNKEAVGQIVGAEGIGALERHIGETVHVYARRLSYSKFTLIGSERYYIRVGKDGSFF